MVFSQNIENLFLYGNAEAAFNSSERRLKIAIEPSGISWFIEVPAFRQIIFSGVLNNSTAFSEFKLKEQFSQLYNSQETLRLSFSDVILLSLSPSLLYNNNQHSKAEMLPLKEGEFHLEEEVPEQPYRLLYSYVSSRFDWIKSYYPEMKLKHRNLGYIQAIQTQKPGQNRIGIIVKQAEMEVLVYNNQNRLLLSNSYPFKSEMDFLYYALMLCQNFGFTQENTYVYLSGEVSIQSRIYKELYKYFGHIEFLYSTAGLSFGGGFEGYLKHSHLGIFNV